MKSMITPAPVTRIAVVFGLVLSVGCSAGRFPTDDQRPKLRLGEELVPQNEAQNIEKIIAIHQDIQEHVDRKLSPVPRGQHPKQHGCVTAEFVIEPNLPDIIRHGMFQRPKTFAAVIRFSNGRQTDDNKPDSHGMAIKLMNVGATNAIDIESDSRTQDFVLMDNPIFFIRNVAEYVPFMDEFRSVAMGSFFSKSWAGLKFLLSPARQYRILREVGSKRPANPLGVQYWSITPSKLGDTAMKFSARPEPSSASVASESSKDKFRLAMSANLQKRDFYFDFLVQAQTDPVRMPVEDPTIAWDEKLSPYLKVATIHIPIQSFESAEQMKVCEDLSFTPWHTLPDHRPIGGINRIRKKLYEVMSKTRHELNCKEVEKH